MGLIVEYIQETLSLEVLVLELVNVVSSITKMLNFGIQLKHISILNCVLSTNETNYHYSRANLYDRIVCIGGEQSTDFRLKGIFSINAWDTSDTIYELTGSPY